MISDKVADAENQRRLMADAAVFFALAMVFPAQAQTQDLVQNAAPACPEMAALEVLTSDALVAEAVTLVRDLYEAEARSEQSGEPSLLWGACASDYFTENIVALLYLGEIGAHPLYGAQDYDGSITRIAPDDERPMFRGMITVHVDFTNFGQPQRATYLVRADVSRKGAPLRIFRVEHEGWAYP